MTNDLMRIIDSICRDKNIDRDSLIADIESAVAGAVRKEFEGAEEAEVKLDPLKGGFEISVDGERLDVHELGRIPAQAAKQMIIQRTRDRERSSIYEDFSNRRGTIVTGTVIRAEGGNLLVNIGRTEGFLPRSEQIPGEAHQPGERLRALILEVREQPNQVKIILSRSHPEFIERLFELEVPEVAEHIIEIRALAREAGYRSKVAVSSIDSKVDAVGACVGVRGSRIKNIVDELSNEKIDIVRWNESSQILIQNALKPAEVQEIALCFELGKATVVVAEDQLSLAIGKRGQNVRLAARLTTWDIDILTPDEYNKHLENLDRIMKSVEGVDDVLVDKLIAFGCVSVMDVDDIGPEPLVKELDLDPELTEKIVWAAGEEVIRQEEEREAAAKAKAEGREEPPAADATADATIGAADETSAASSFVAAGTTAAAADTAAASVSPETAPDAGEPEAAEVTQESTAIDEAVPGGETPSETPPSALTPAPAEAEAPPVEPADESTGLSADQPEEAAISGQVTVEPPEAGTAEEDADSSAPTPPEEEQPAAGEAGESPEETPREG